MEKFINLTPSPCTLLTRGQELITIPRDQGGRVRVEHDQHGAAPITSGRHVIEVHPALWDSPNAGGLGVDGLPAPAPGVSILVTGHMAEIVALTGREISDLFVPIERAHSRVCDQSDARVYASLCPASYATPAMSLILEHIARNGKPVIKHPGVRGCYTIAGYDVRTVIDVRDHFGDVEVLASYSRLTDADLASIRRWEGSASHARAD